MVKGQLFSWAFLGALSVAAAGCQTGPALKESAGPPFATITLLFES